MKLKKQLFLLCFLVLINSCSKVQVSQDYDPGFIFGTAISFNWQTESPPTDNSSTKTSNELLDKRFHKAIEDNFLKRGLLLTGSPDLLISYTYSVVSKLEADPFSPGFGFGYGSFGRYGGVGIQTGSNIRQYDLGVLVIAIQSGTTNELLWRGIGTRQVFTHSSPETVTKEVIETVEAILKQFPPE